MLQKERESWKGLADSLLPNKRETFLKMLNECHRYQDSINLKGEPFPTEALLMGLILHSIRW